MVLMEETQFSLSVWDTLPATLKSSAIRMTSKEVAWDKENALLAVSAFREKQIAIDGIEFFFFRGINEPLQATSNIFSSSKTSAETWREYVSRSCDSAESFIIETYDNEKGVYEGTPIFNIWAVAANE